MMQIEEETLMDLAHFMALLGKQHVMLFGMLKSLAQSELVPEPLRQVAMGTVDKCDAEMGAKYIAMAKKLGVTLPLN